MPPLVECVPNFSEGRDRSVVDRIVAAMVQVPGVRLLDSSMDAGHNRSVVTIIGKPEAVAEAAFRGVAVAAKLIDLRTHRGEHPRMGAADVVPFIPVRDVDMAACVGLARRVGERIGRELAIPVFLYEEAATRPERRNLAEVRAPQFEGLLSLVGADPAWKPDFGPEAIHPTAGAVAVGARPPLVAYNAYLNSSDQAVARAIARAVRHQTGGLRYVKALGMAPDEKGRVQVSMNLTNTAGTPIHRVLEMIRSEAARYGVTVVESEIVGVVSADALLDAAEFYLQLNSFSRSQVLELRLLEEEGGPGGLLETSVADFAERVASPAAVPGGGSVSALLGALASSLVAMVSRLTLGRKRFEAVEEKMKALEARAEALRQRLLELVEADAAAYAAYLEVARRVKSGGPVAKGALQEAVLAAARVPLQSARASLEAMELALDAARLGNPVARIDAQVAALSAHAAVLGAALNVRANLPLLRPDQKPEEMEAEVASLEKKAAQLLPEVLAAGRGETEEEIRQAG